MSALRGDDEGGQIYRGEGRRAGRSGADRAWDPGQDHVRRTFSLRPLIVAALPDFAVPADGVQAAFDGLRLAGGDRVQAHHLEAGDAQGGGFLADEVPGLGGGDEQEGRLVEGRLEMDQRAFDVDDDAMAARRPQWIVVRIRRVS